MSEELRVEEEKKRLGELIERRKGIIQNLRNSKPPVSPDLIRAYENIHTDSVGAESANLEKTEIALNLREGFEEDGILKKEKLLYIGSGTDIEYPLLLGGRNLLFIDPVFEDEEKIKELEQRIKTLDPEARIVQENGQFKACLNFCPGEGEKESVTVEVLPIGIQDYSPSDSVGGILAFNSRGPSELLSIFTNQQLLEKIIKGGYILDNESSPIRLKAAQETIERQMTDDELTERERQIANQVGLEKIDTGYPDNSFYRIDDKKKFLEFISEYIEEQRLKTNKRVGGTIPRASIITEEKEINQAREELKKTFKEESRGEDTVS